VECRVAVEYVVVNLIHMFEISLAVERRMMRSSVFEEAIFAVEYLVESAGSHSHLTNLVVAS